MKDNDCASQREALVTEVAELNTRTELLAEQLQAISRRLNELSQRLRDSDRTKNHNH